MGISVYPVPSSGKSQRFAVFNSSGTWTAPTSSSYDGLVTIFAVGGGGGGGGGGAGAPHWGGNNGRPGGSSGGGGGGGQVIDGVTVAVPAGTSVPVTIGAGGTGGQLENTEKTINYFLNPNLRVNANGFSAVTNVTSLQRDTGYGSYSPSAPLSLGNNGSLFFNIQNSPAAFSFRYDTGNGAFTVDSGTRGYKLYACMMMDATNQNLTYTTTVAWFNNTTEIRSDTYTSTTGVGSPSGAWFQILLAYQNETRPIPTNANRFTMTVSFSGHNINTSMRFLQFSLTPNELDSYNYVGSTANNYYIDGSMSFSGTSENPVFWAGTANASVTKIRGGAGRALNPGNSFNMGGSAGAPGTKGGDTSFGSYITAYGGGAGMGGQEHYYTWQGSSWGGSNYIVYRFSGDDNQRYGGNGGGAGGSSGGQNPTNNRGGGGGGAGGFGRTVTGSYGLQFTGSSAAASSSSTFFVASEGGLPLKNRYGAGGSSGGTGSTSYPVGQTGNSTQSGGSGNGSSAPIWLHTLGGNGGSANTPGLGGTATAGSNGANATLPGSGGGGGGGGGSSTSTTVNGSTYAMPGNGGNGGNGSAGILIASWWE